MANTAQCKMLLARARVAGVELKWEDVVDLNNGQINEKLKAMGQYRPSDEYSKGEPKPVEPLEINSVRFGMCCKLVIQQRGINVCLEDSKKFSEFVVNMYELTARAEEAVKSASSSSPKPFQRQKDIALEQEYNYHNTPPDNQDALAEATRKRYLEDREVM